MKRAFGVLQSRFAIVKGPAHFWEKDVIHDIMSTCIILHNMIIEDKRDLDARLELKVKLLLQSLKQRMMKVLYSKNFLLGIGKSKTKKLIFHFETS